MKRMIFVSEMGPQKPIHYIEIIHNNHPHQSSIAYVYIYIYIIIDHYKDVRSLKTIQHLGVPQCSPCEIRRIFQHVFGNYSMAIDLFGDLSGNIPTTYGQTRGSTVPTHFRILECCGTCFQVHPIRECWASPDSENGRY